MTDNKTSSIIAAEEAIALVRKGEAVVFLDVRFAPGKADLKRGYEEAHIAGAHFVDLPTQLQGKGGRDRRRATTAQRRAASIRYHRVGYQFL